MENVLSAPHLNTNSHEWTLSKQQTPLNLVFCTSKMGTEYARCCTLKSKRLLDVARKQQEVCRETFWHSCSVHLWKRKELSYMKSARPRGNTSVLFGSFLKFKIYKIEEGTLGEDSLFYSGQRYLPLLLSPKKKIVGGKIISSSQEWSCIHPCSRILSLSPNHLVKTVLD